jgi:hypothetical protein
MQPNCQPSAQLRAAALWPNRIHVVLLNMQNRTFGPYLSGISRPGMEPALDASPSWCRSRQRKTP